MAADPELVKQISCEGLDNLLALIDENKDSKNLYLYFCGAIDETGESWCPDCRNAEKVVESGLAKAPEGSVFILCVVGDKPTWKNPQNEFRKHEKIQLTSIPTLMNWKTGKRHGDEDCQKQDVVDKFFQE